MAALFAHSPLVIFMINAKISGVTISENGFARYWGG